ncbi:hypothetical protein VITU102760_24800 [Vibrio tubiashii]|uniref:Type II secretion system protein GspF domain-containing protein n=1 Tax=Vibrio tubiashii ATCC 19109 TaxID=1051646 RepID=F9T6T2_9VIBR|nr:hypothetical protein [Vibrio tubiashii]AIW17496.1 hypothetical protein IX91_25910 [Vibrio tubiashii ATCC 19109]EGU54487.1 hypothetical protein VITU9109_02897 [Vibrio tubiashii ATCC 19109]EIF05990.1 hypothetical protein VT1337_00585 [Vibrio tubiashii NCIMB 1337 = ATCC 19106]
MIDESDGYTIKKWFAFVVREARKSLNWSKKKQAETLSTLLVLIENKLYLKDAASLLVDHGNNKEKYIGAKIDRHLGNGTINEAVDSLEPDLSLTAFQALKAGTYANDIEAGLSNAIEALRLSDSVSWSLFWHLIKPFFGVIISCGITIIFSSKVMPIIETIIDVEQLPGIVIVADYVGSFFEIMGLPILVICSVLLTAIFFSLPFLTGNVRQKLDALPIYKQYRVLVSTMLLRSLTDLIKSSVSLDDALSRTKAISSPYLSEHLQKMMGSVDKGESNIGVILDTGLLLDEQAQVLKILGKTPDHEAILKSSSEIHKAKLTTTIDHVKAYGQSIIKSVGFAFIGLTLIAIVLSFLTIRASV